MVRTTYVSEYLARITIAQPEKMPALTGISKKVFDILLERPLLSLEIKSCDNINALSSIEKGHYIFLTPILRADLLPRGEGVICQLQSKNVSLQKVKKWDEVEIVAVRIQVKPLCTGRIKAIEKRKLGEGVLVEVERAFRCSIS